MQRASAHQAATPARVAFSPVPGGLPVQRALPPSAECLPQRIVSTRREWLREPSLYDRLHSGRNDSGVHLEHSTDFPASSAAAACLPTSVKSSSTISLKSLKLHSHAALAGGGCISLAIDAPESSSDSGYSSPNRPSSTVDALRSDPMPHSTFSPSLSSLPSERSLPSLSSASSTTTNCTRETPSEPTPITGTAFRRLNDELVDGGALMGPATTQQQIHHRISLPCVFGFLGCDSVMNDRATWLTHCAYHFYGKPLPLKTMCTFCDTKFATRTGTYQHGTPSAWQQRMDCMYRHLMNNGASMANCLPDFDLFRYLWRSDVISVDDYAELQRRPHRLARYRGPLAVHEGRRTGTTRRPRGVPAWERS